MSDFLQKYDDQEKIMADSLILLADQSSGNPLFHHAEQK